MTETNPAAGSVVRYTTPKGIEEKGVILSLDSTDSAVIKLFVGSPETKTVTAQRGDGKGQWRPL